MLVSSPPSEDVLRIWSSLSEEEKLTRFRSSPSSQANDLFQTLETRDQAELLLLLPPAERGFWLQLLPLDDAADLIQCLARTPAGAA